MSDYDYISNQIKIRAGSPFSDIFDELRAENEKLKKKLAKIVKEYDAKPRLRAYTSDSFDEAIKAARERE